jgi:asparagine synthase (glutamine-hydrolysing)
MSVQFGRWNLDGRPADPDYLRQVNRMLAPYGGGQGTPYTLGSVSMLFCAFATTKEARSETQPQVAPHGTIFMWDGRLDNRADLLGRLGEGLSNQSTDAAIVASAYTKWGNHCLPNLIGDWALSVWNPNEMSLTLAKDPVGTRPLYYSVEANQVTWSTILDPLVLLAGRSFVLDKEYVAGWFCLFPAAHLSPYVGIHSVPPSSLVVVRAGTSTVKKYWEFDPQKRIRYRTDGEYEEHFRAVFAESVRRRLRSDTPVLAELSGGMDSSSIVCMADTLIGAGTADVPRLDTLSYYDDSEPNWNERPYFSRVEQHRGRAGCHINVGAEDCFGSDPQKDRFTATPVSTNRASSASAQFASCLNSQGNRVVLSGIGGDEVLGGVPSPVPELADLLARGRFLALAKRLTLWSLSKRRPWLHLLFEAARGFLPLGLVKLPQHRRPVSWLDSTFIAEHPVALTAYEERLSFFGPLPSFQDNLSTLDTLRRQLGCFVPSAEPVYETRLPYLDRDLLEFLFAIPRDQIVRPGQRRSLMRRALGGIVPAELLARKRKAYVVRGPMTAVSKEWPNLVELCQNMISGSLGIIEPERFLEALVKARQGHEVPLAPLLRSITIENWLKNLSRNGILAGMPEKALLSPNRFVPTLVSAEKNQP